jgi:hypothetical protein
MHYLFNEFPVVVDMFPIHIKGFLDMVVIDKADLLLLQPTDSSNGVNNTL